MANQLGPLDISCDAPPYSVVTACRRVGFEDPEDVRWCRLNQIMDTPSDEWEMLKRHPWRLLIRMASPDVKSCRCGQRMPTFDRYTFTYLTGHESSYLLGQCARCKTVYWEEA
jgi:hypothetical protein